MTPRIVRAILVAPTGRVFVQLRADSSVPTGEFPGGHVEPGESMLAAVTREIAEETGYEGPYTGIRERFTVPDYRGRPVQFFVLSVDREFVPAHNEEAHSGRWVLPHTLPPLLPCCQRAAMRYIRRTGRSNGFSGASLDATARWGNPGMYATDHATMAQYHPAYPTTMGGTGGGSILGTAISIGLVVGIFYLAGYTIAPRRR